MTAQTELTAKPDDTPQPETLIHRIRRSFDASIGSIVFGMEDGTVSIFGLVFGVAAAAPNSHAVLLAGATGAVAAAVSMMAGTYLDVESTNDQAAARLVEARTRYDNNQRDEDLTVRRRLVAAGFKDAEADTVIGVISHHPDTELKVVTAVDLGASDTTPQNPFVQSAWMLLTDLFAAAVPVIPFAVFALGTARIVSVSVTFVLLVVLGIGRSAVGHRRLLPTVAETIGIAAAAACAGVLVGKLIS
jgi:vacuolar iron transporter family protein